MARYTIREFTEVVGLGKDRDSVTRSGIILKALCGLGIAQEIGKKQGSNGRPAVVYEVQDPITIPLCKATVIHSEPVAVQEVADGHQGGYYDDDEDE